MKLLKPTHEYSGEIMEYKHAFLQSGEQPHGSSSLQNFDSLDEWFEKSEYTRTWGKLKS